MNPRILLLCALIFTGALFTSCEDDGQENQNDASRDYSINPTKDNEAVIELILKQGYKREEIKELDHYFLAQEDILFSKNIEDYQKQPDPDARHAHTNNLVASGYRVITVAIDNSSIPLSGVDSWSTALTAAMTEWNNITNCSITFVSFAMSDADIIIKSDNGSLPNNVIAAAGFPANGKAYSQILINLDFNNNMTVSESTKKYNMAHELGHAIGFRHTNWDAIGEGVTSWGANYIPNTPTQDNSSVMNGGTALNSWNSFSAYDQYSVRYLYPDQACNFRLVSVESACAFDRYDTRIEYNIIVVNRTVSASAIWSVSGNSLEISTIAPWGCKVRVKQNNTVWPATGVITVQDQGCTRTFNMSLGNCINYSYSD